MANKQLLLIALVFIALSSVVYAQRQPVGEEVFIQYESQHPYHLGIQSNEVVWTQEIVYTDGPASYVAVHFSRFNLADGDKLILRSPSGERRWEYTSKDNDRGGFWSIPIYGNQAIIEIISKSGNSSFGYVIDKIARGFTSEEIENTSLTICNEDDREEAKCYKDSEVEVYDKSRAVARLWINGVANCTGWLVGDEGHMMTAEHCIENEMVANNTVVEMMAEGEMCTSICETPGACRGQFVADHVELIQNNADLDYALVLLPTNASLAYGYLTMRGSGAVVGERIYLPQHPNGWGKQIALFSDGPNEAEDGSALVQTITQVGICTPGANSVGYYADTDSGSSGSPVIAYDDHCVVAVHGCTGCVPFTGDPVRPNDGMNTSLIIEDLDFIPNAAITEFPRYSCETGGDVHIFSDKTYDSDMGTMGDVYVHSGTLTITATVKFGEGNKLIVEDGAKLILDGGTLTKCSEANSWGGVEIQDGAEMVSYDSYIHNAFKGINALSGSVLDLNNNEILGNEQTNSGIGVHLDGSVSLTDFRDTKIANYNTGVLSNNNAEVCFLNRGEISNTTYGIRLLNSADVVYVFGYNIDAALAGIDIDNSVFSVIDRNNIEFGASGIRVRNSKYPIIFGNSTTHLSRPGRTAINMTNCSRARIFNNNGLHATQFGIKLLQSDAHVYNNTLDINLGIEEATNENGGGIQMTTNGNSIIRNNFITAYNCSFGIESITGLGNEMSHNEISVESFISTRTAAIRSMGSMFETIDNNKIDGQANIAGIIAQNSTGNVFECNEITNTIEGLAVYNNSAGQTIRGNKFLDSDIDLSIQSVIGQQEYAGNEFVNGSVRAIGLSPQEIAFSIFLVNQNYPHHLPSDPLPGGNQWFINDSDEDNYFDDCTVISASGNFHDDNEKLSAYFDAVKLLEAEQPKVFKTRLYDLLKYQQVKSNYNLPDDIRQDAVMGNLCGLQELVDISSRLEGLTQSNIGLNANEHNNIQLLIEEIASEASNPEVILNDLSQSVSALMPAIENENMAHSSSLDEIKTDLENINCQDNYTTIWKNIYTMYIDFLQTGEVTEKHQTDLIEYSRECSDQYGDVIHIARSLSNTFDDTYFDVYDDCSKEENEKLKLRSTHPNALAAFVQPNPSKGSIVLYTEAEVTGTIKVIDLSGRLVYTATMVDENQHNLNLNEGLYFVYLISNAGEVFAEKVIVTK